MSGVVCAFILTENKFAFFVLEKYVCFLNHSVSEDITNTFFSRVLLFKISFITTMPVKAVSHSQLLLLSGSH